MGNEWVERNVEEVANVFGGGTPSTKDEANFNGEIPWITPKDLSGYPFRYISRGERNISKKGLNCSNAKLLPVGTVLLTTRAPVGYVAIAANPVTTNQGFHSLVPHNGYSSEFIYYLLKANAEYLKSNASGTTFGELSGSTLKRLKFVFPSIPEQRAIADVLGSLDDKIELNRHMNATLESMARAVFKAWFVENEEAKGWKAGHLSDICNISIGGDWGEDDPFEGASKVACLRGVDLEKLRENGFSDAPFRWVKKASIEKRGLSKNDILIAGSGIGPVGRPLWVSPELLDLYGCPVIYSNFCKRFTAISPAHAVYIDRLFYEMRQSNEIWEYVNGTSIPNLDSDGLLNRCPIVIPPVDLLNAYYDFVKPIYSKLYSRESRTLAALRDALLPRLMGGEVRAKLEAQNEN